MNDWQNALGRPLSATDQPPGTYRYRACRGAPWQPLRLLWDGFEWHCLLRGEVVSESGRKDPNDIPFIRNRGPFHPISIQEYLELITAYRNARPGSPLSTPDLPVDFRRSSVL